MQQKLEQYASTHGDGWSVFSDNSDLVVRFLIDSTPFEGRIKYVPLKTWEILIWLYLPQIQERFFIESKGNWFPEKDGCRRISLPPLDSKYKVHCSNEVFVRNLLGGPLLIHELMSFPEDSVDHLKIYLRDGYLMAKWRFMFGSHQAMRDHRDDVLPARFEFLAEHLKLYYEGFQLQSALRPAQVARA